MKYLLLLRGINVGGKNKVVMSELRAQIEALGYEAVTTYINSGNAFFETEEPLERIKAKIGDMLATYPFTIYHVVLSRDAYLADAAQVPDWWQEPLARRDVLFYTDQVDYEHMKARIQAMPLHDEVVYFGDRAMVMEVLEEVSSGANTRKVNTSRPPTTSTCLRRTSTHRLPSVMARPSINCGTC